MLICCGEALIDMIPTPTVEGPDGFVPHCGGAIFNTAIALGRLGANSAMLSGVSTDLFGQRLADALSGAHVSTDMLIRSDRPTTMAFVTLVDGKASYNFYDENSAGRMITPSDLPETLSDSIEAFYFGGISLACEPGADAYAALCDRVHTDHVVMIDPNIRPGFIRDQDRFRARLDAMLGQSDIIKISDEDLDWLRPESAPLDEKAFSLCESGPAVVILTRGRDGASAYFGDGRSLHVPARPAQVVDTVGAGDTFNAGVLFRLSELGLLNKAALRDIDTGALSDALGFGARVAAVTVSRAGANPPWRSEVPN
ncbi:carbohydrate kinase [Pseudooceanicola sediminis]|uniref:Carbohydrate kinase n=1 Tax=Pseudooceanicola sediminis TaxID=2211117 RepID=A0A399JDJ7_9RHOB|nr:carbohydrate kinase [Pseudooceanicola sediminis]KAA2316846.1 carbohydrate kinase [Puniceibacterium sp. HSS470]RII40696.1 carbohydrate kinase [Pseudooceanicola sediminis]